MSYASFVKRAPEIAEELLLKAASATVLPSTLRSFQRDLLTKEASDVGEKLELPPRMSLSDLQKLAHENKVALPTVNDAPSDEWEGIAASLVKVAKTHEDATAREVFETGAAIAAMKKEAGTPAGGAAIAAPAAAAIPRLGFFGRHFTRAGSRAKEVEEALHQARMSKLPGTPQHEMATLLKTKAEKGTAEEAAASRRHELAQLAARQAPWVAGAAGAGAIGTAMALKGKDEKKEEVKIYK